MRPIHIAQLDKARPVLILTREEAEKAKEILASINEPVYEVGEITEGSQDVIVTGGLFNK